MIHDKRALVLLVRARALHALGRTDEALDALREDRDEILARAAEISDLEIRRSFLSRVSAHARTLSLCREWLGDESACCFPRSFVMPFSRSSASTVRGFLTIARRRIELRKVGESGKVVQNGKSSLATRRADRTAR
jgi:hypothetical protein